MAVAALRLRPAAEIDLAAILDLLEASGLPTKGVARHFSNFVLAVDGSVLAGCAGLEVHGQAGLLRSVAVSEPYCSSGLGEQLVKAVLNEAVQRDLRSVSLLTTTAAGYFPRFGFQVTERARLPSSLNASAEFRGACPATATALRLDLREVTPPLFTL